MFDSVVFFFDDASEYKGIEPNELKALADGFNQQLVESLKGSYPIVAEPGPDVLRIRFAITDLKQSNPPSAALRRLIPVGLAVSAVKKGRYGSWAGSGATGAEMMALDSLTNDVIGVAKDEKAAGFTERFSKWGSAEGSVQVLGRAGQEVFGYCPREIGRLCHRPRGGPYHRLSVGILSIRWPPRLLRHATSTICLLSRAAEP